MGRTKVQKTRKGFTMIEVSIFLAITGLLLIGVLGGTYSAIARERYNDSVRSFAEYFRQIYGEVLSPESLGSGNSNTRAIYGKVVVFGLESPDDDDSRDQDNIIYSATLVGDIHPVPAPSFISELQAVNAQLFCGSTTDNDEPDSTLSTYTPLWGTKVHNTDNKPFHGILIIARAPNSGTVNVAYASKEALNGRELNLRDGCSPTDSSASSMFEDIIKNQSNAFSSGEDIDICLESENSVIVRDVRLTAYSRNTSAVNTVPEEDSKCQRD